MENVKKRIGKEIISEVLKYVGVNAPTFANMIGVNYQRINDLQTGKVQKVSQDLANKIMCAYPQLDMRWLLTGEGRMLVQPTQVTPARGRIRYWMDVDATGGFKELAEDGMSGRYMDIDIPEFRECHDACNIYGDSMSPLYKNGQIIILKEWTENFIEYGNVYLIITKSGNRMVKFLRKGSDNAHVLCASENPEYDPFEIEKADILKLYVVKGGISKNAL